MVAYTERDLEQYMDTVIQAGMIKSLKERILEQTVISMVDKYRKYEDRLYESEFIGESDRKDKERLLRKMWERFANNRSRASNEEVNMGPKTINTRAWQIALLGAGWLVAFVMAFFL
jgi:hypothetical protein